MMKTRTHGISGQRWTNRLRMIGNNKGFSSIIWIVAIATICLLIAIAIPNFIGYGCQSKSYCTATVNDVGAIGGALADYFANPANVTASTQYNPATDGDRPYILVGKTGGDKDGYNANTLLLSTSTTIPGTAAQFVPAAAAGAFKSGADYVVYACEGAGTCPKKITSSDTHWVNYPVTKTPCTNPYCCYFKTL
ncbi:hypothetical protein VU06_04610 [Desulfobulbus sp. F3]|nr:hypothetical protein [Desulfobulbus sp. F3]